MSNSILFHVAGVKGFDHHRWDWGGGMAVEHIARQATRFRCPSCGGRHVTATPVGHRDVKAGKLGRLDMVLRVETHRLKCHGCGAFRMEVFEFLSSPTSHITRQMERTIIELRQVMCIKAVAEWLGLDWRTVKEVEKAHLKRKYRHIRLKGVRVIGVDEIHVGHNRYKTIVRDLLSGAVLYIGEGRGGEALEGFGRLLRGSKAKIKTVAMDMSAGFAAWFRDNLPEAEIVFDHFHVIQLMNKKLDNVRRRTAKELEAEEAKALKKKRFLFLRNEDDLDQNESGTLNKLLAMFPELGIAEIMKERLRNIYTLAKDDIDAEIMFRQWCADAAATKIPELTTMGKTLKTHLPGILAYWTTDGVNSGAVEGFNNKIRWLIKQAYGYRDWEYFDLKVHDLPNLKTVAEL